MAHRIPSGLDPLMMQIRTGLYWPLLSTDCEHSVTGSPLRGRFLASSDANHCEHRNHQEVQGNDEEIENNSVVDASSRAPATPRIGTARGVLFGNSSSNRDGVKLATGVRSGDLSGVDSPVNCFIRKDETSELMLHSLDGVIRDSHVGSVEPRAFADRRMPARLSQRRLSATWSEYRHRQKGLLLDQISRT